MRGIRLQVPVVSRRHPSLPVVTCLVSLAVAVGAGPQTVPPPTTTPPPTVPPVVVPSNPPVMSRPSTTKTVGPATRSAASLVIGQVTDTSGAAVPRAVVRLMGDRAIETVVADAKGRFAFKDIPLGEVVITAEKIGYFNGGYGQRRASGLPLPFSVPFGQVMPNMRIELYRAGVITGAVTDEAGEPVVGVPVIALRRQFASGQWQYVSAASEATDDQGQYRVFGLPPGEYIVSVPSTQIPILSPDGIPLEDAAPPVVFPTLFYPATDLRIRAAPVVLAAGEVRHAVNFSLPLVTAHRVTGRLTGPAFSRQPVRLVPVDANWADVSDAAITTSATDGTFAFARVPSGRYQLQAGHVTAGMRPAAQDAAPAPASFWGRVDVTVADRDVDVSDVEMQPTASITGRIVSERSAGDASGTAPPTGIALTVEPAGPGLSRVTTLSARANGRFSVSNLIPGEYFVRVETLPRGWFVRSISGTGGMDAAVDVRDGQAHVEVVLTTQASQVIGTVRDSRMQFAAGAAIIIVPATAGGAGIWTPNRVRETRASASGVFNVKGLPPGDYLVVAIDDAVAEGWQDPRRLAALRPLATRFSLRDAETISLVLTRR